MLRFACICVLSCLSQSGLCANWTITYPRPLTEFDQRYQYPVALLTLALEKTGVKYSLMQSERILMQGRALQQLEENREINLVWSMTDRQRESNLHPIRIPIYKGLIGWRLFLVPAEHAGILDKTNTLEQLRHFSPVQGKDWPDTRILQANGFKVITGNEYGQLFRLLQQRVGDFFPRSVIEVWGELDSPAIQSCCELDTRLAVSYPTAMYFFVNKKNKTLAKLIETGLERAIADGSFDTLFEQTYGPVLEKARMTQRRVFELNNPLLPDDTPLERPELWYKPVTTRNADQRY